MKKRLGLILGTLALCALIPAAAQAAEPGECEVGTFGFCKLGVQITDVKGNPSTQAGSHPLAIETTIDLNTEEDPELKGEVPSGQLRKLSGELPPGLTGSPFAVPQCSSVDFTTTVEVSGIRKPNCSDSSVVGLLENDVVLGSGTPVRSVNSAYNLVPPPGVALRIGFIPYGSTVPPVTVDFAIKDTPPFNVTFATNNVTQMVRVLSSTLTIWGNPSDPAHNEERGVCGLFLEILGFPLEPPVESCPTSNPNRPFLTLPRSCTTPLAFPFKAISWLGDVFEETIATPGFGFCSKLGLSPTVSSEPTTDRVESPSGLDFNLDLADEGLTDPKGTAKSDIKKAVVTLPVGVTANPSQAEGLVVCTEADFEREKAGSEFGAGCPAASKIGTTEVETPLLEGKILKGSLFIAEPYKNRFGTLLALYMTFKEPALGISIKLAGKVEPDPKTGQLVTTFDDLPQQPFSHFRLHFREGGRSPLITPPACGTYTTEALFTPWANPEAPLPTTASFEITAGVDGGPCPPGGTPPFKPGFTAGTLNNDAGAYSPFYMKLTRRDGDQDMTRFSAKFPPGLVAKLAGTTRCPQARIALAKTKTGSSELASPSCPKSSEIGNVTAGAGVGSQLTYVDGKVYLAGSFNGAPLSVVGIVPAVAGPFDVGTVVAQQALRINARSAEVTADGAASDPIPHILAGIPLKVRDIRVNVDRPQFTLNPTSCDPFAVNAQLWGGGANVFSVADDAPVSLSSRFQAANCERLGFKPSLSLKLKGGTKRGDHPKLRGVFEPRPGDANVKELVLRFPRSAFLDQGHIRTICTRVQFAADKCPKGSVYGQARAFTPLLSEPLEGPAYLRSSNHNLPDVVFDLHGLIDVEVVGRIDSKRGGIRASFEDTPDAPISKVIVTMQGGEKGLIVNSTNLCARKRRAALNMAAQNNKTRSAKPTLRASCKKKRGRKGR